MGARFRFVLLIVVTALVTGSVYEQCAVRSAGRYTGKEGIASARYARYANYFKGRRFVGDNVPRDFCAPAARAIPGTAHVVATQGEMGFSMGSGTIISSDGYIVTNRHVIDGAADIHVTLSNRQEFAAVVVGSDASADLAVLKVDAKGLPFLLWANSNDVRVGQWVLAVGYPFSLASTVTAGIVSAKGTSLVPADQPVAKESFIQTDAAVNFGNSGGPLVDLSGDVIGINTAMATPTGAYTGYSFAIPSNIARKIVHDIIEYGGVRKK